MHPVLLHLGHLIVPTFGLLAALGLIAALTLSERTAPLVALPANTLWNAGLFAVLAAFVLSRLLLVLAAPRSFAQFPLLLLTLPSLTATGLLLTALATGLWLRLRHLPLLAVLDAWAPCATLLWAFLAAGHFAEGSDPGLPTRLPWGVRMPGIRLPQHPVALYATLLALALTFLLLSQLRIAPRGNIAALALVLAGIAQYSLSFLREPLLAVYTPTPLVEPLQWLALGFILSGALLFLTRPGPHSAPSRPVSSPLPAVDSHAV